MIELMWQMAAQLKCCGADWDSLAPAGFNVEAVSLDAVSGECFGFHIDATIDMTMCCPD